MKLLRITYCKLCQNREVKNEIHFTLKCPFYNDLRFPILHQTSIQIHKKCSGCFSWLSATICLTLSMLKLVSSKGQGGKYFWKPSTPCHVGIHWKAVTEHSQMSTNLPGFQSFSSFFASFCFGQISKQQHKGEELNLKLENNPLDRMLSGNFLKLELKVRFKLKLKQTKTSS